MICIKYFRKYAHLPGPKRTSFFLGNVQLMASGIRKKGNMGSLFLDLILEFGDVVILWRATAPTIITSDLTVVKEYYTNFKLFKKPKTGIFELRKIGQTNFLGVQSIVTDPGGSNWERKKRIMDPGFKVSRLQDQICKFYLVGE